MMTVERTLLYLHSVTGAAAHYIKTSSQKKGGEKYIQFWNSLANGHCKCYAKLHNNFIFFLKKRACHTVHEGDNWTLDCK